MSNYRFLRIAGLHYNADELYRANPQWLNKSYAQQQEALFNDALTYSNGMTNALGRLGHEVHEVVYDLKPMQETWAREQGVRYGPESWQTDILLKQIERFRPDVVYFQDLTPLPDECMDRLKENFPFLRLVVYYKGSSGLKHCETSIFFLIGIPTMVRSVPPDGDECQIAVSRI